MDKNHHAKNHVQKTCTKPWVGPPTIFGYAQLLLALHKNKFSGIALDPVRGGMLPLCKPTNKGGFHLLMTPLMCSTQCTVHGTSHGKNITHTQHKSPLHTQAREQSVFQFVIWTISTLNYVRSTHKRTQGINGKILKRECRTETNYKPITKT